MACSGSAACGTAPASSVYARRQATRSPARCRRRGPIGAAPDDVLVAHVRRVLEASPFHGEGYRKAWAKLRVAGMCTSKERVRRLMREHDLQAPQRAGRGRHDEHPYQLFLAVNDIDHTKTKVKSPQTNVICERFHKTVLQEFYQVAFRKKLL